MIQQRAYDRMIEKFENIGNSVSFYLLLLAIGFGIWILTPFAPDWRPDGTIFGLIAIIFAGLTMLHGLLWLLITRESLKLPKNVRAAIATAIRFIRPLHMMTGMLALGVVLIHAYAYLNSGLGWKPNSVTGLLALIVLGILALDGIGLMASPLLSRLVHRWLAALFVAALTVHLWIAW